ncbi:MAG TPA: HNH endonuclease [Myxococcaceae bacterium]|nr:HNH endonuclease [Myxococcaceae bacterium]
MVRRLVVLAAIGPLCTSPEIREQCRYTTEHTRQPEMARELALIDSLILNRLLRLTVQVRELHTPVSAAFRVHHADQFLPQLCGQIDLARELATAGRTREAARVYQGLLLASQVAELSVAMIRMAEYADAALQPTEEILQTLATFAAQMQPFLDEAASRDAGRIRRAETAARPVFAVWIAYLEQWSLRIERGQAQAKTAKHIWDTVMLCVAAYEAAEGLAAIIAEGGPGGPFSLAGGAAVASTRASPELVEALRKLVAEGALDASVVASLGRMASPPSGGAAVPLPDPSLPTIAQMGERKPPPNMEKVKKVNGRYPINAEYAGQKYPVEKLRSDLRAKYPDSVRFTEEGFPDFKPYTLKEVELDNLEGNLDKDFAKADRAAGISEKYRTANDLTWHHHQDGHAMQLVPRDIHQAVRHTGGVAILGGGDVD